MGGSSKAPAPRDYSKEMTDSLQSQVRLAPELYQAEQQYRPLYTALDMQSLDETINGREASQAFRTVKEKGYRNVYTGEWSPTPGSTSSPGGANNASYLARTFGKRRPSHWAPAEREVQQEYTVPGHRGMVDIYENDIAPAYSRMENTAREASVAGDMAIIDQYGGRVGAAVRNASGNTNLLNSLNAQAQSELDAGATLDPSLRREVQQAIRSGQAARGFGYGRNDLASESYMTAMQAEQLRRARQQFGIQMVGVNQATSGDPFMALLGRQSTTQSANAFGGNAQATSKSIGSVLFNPESQYNSDLNNQAYQAAAANSAGNAANKSAMIGAGIGGVALIGAAVF